MLVTFEGKVTMHMFVPALTIAGRDLRVDAAIIRMTISAYSAGLGAGQLVYGPPSDTFARRPALLVGLAPYTAGGVAAMLAPDAGVLMATRFVQGAGGSAGLLQGRAIVRDSAESNDTVRRLALMSLMTTMGPGVAPVAGGLLASKFGWRGVFVVLTAMGVVNFATSWRL
jgi:DHA1 family bicyclomycin/chloramphenicol resistance-like MFS transporter